MTDDMSLNLIYEDETISSNKEIRKVYCLVEVDLVN